MNDNARFRVGGIVVSAEWCEHELERLPHYAPGPVTVPAGEWYVEEVDPQGEGYAVAHDQFVEHYEPINIPALRELRRSAEDVDYIPGDE